MEQVAHHSGLTEIAIVALAAMGCGIFMERLRQPAIVGYILAGILLGPSMFALVTDRDQIDVLAELGVLMLLYVVGMELSLRAFRRIWRIAMLTTLIQIGASTGVMLIFWWLLDWPIGIAILLGFVVALSSTAVAIKVLSDIGELRTRVGTITVGVLIAQDLAVVPMMLIVGALGAMTVAGAEGGFDWIAVPKILASIALLAGLILYLSRGKKISIPFSAVVAGHEDLKPLAALVFCFAAASLSGLFGLSAAYGAFIAGIVVGSSTERHVMIEATKPIQSILMMVFFLSIGLLLDLGFIWDNLGLVMSLFLVVAVFKTILNVGALRLLGQDWNNAFIAGVMLTQIGEFSFLLSQIGVGSGLISSNDSRIVVAVTVLSLALSPLYVFTARRLQALAEEGTTSAKEIMRAVYAPEAEVVAETLDGARSSTRRTIRLLMYRWRLLVREIKRRREARKNPLIVGANPQTPSNENPSPEAGVEGNPETAVMAEKKQTPKKKPTKKKSRA